MARQAHPKFHSECDVATLVYGPADQPDAVLEAFVEDLRRQGFDAVGLLQRRRSRSLAACDPIDYFLIEREGEGPDAREARAAASASCGSRLLDLGEQVAHILERRPDIVVLNRFGWLEASGSGLLGLLADAIERDVPVLTAVPEPLFARWLDVAQGLAVRLRCDRDSIDRWWAALGRAALPPGLAKGFASATNEGSRTTGSRPSLGRGLLMGK